MLTFSWKQSISRALGIVGIPTSSTAKTMKKKDAGFAIKNAKATGEKGVNDDFVKGCPWGRVKTVRNQKID